MCWTTYPNTCSICVAGSLYISAKPVGPVTRIALLTYKVIQSCQPVYLLKPLNRTRNLRSSDDDQLVVPRVSSKMGERAFIPLEIEKSKSAQSFWKKMKTLYFGQAFPS